MLITRVCVILQLWQIFMLAKLEVRRSNASHPPEYTYLLLITPSVAYLGEGAFGDAPSHRTPHFYENLRAQCVHVWYEAICCRHIYFETLFHSASEHTIVIQKISKIFLGWGVAPSPDSTPSARGFPSRTHPSSAPMAPRPSRLRRSTFGPFTKILNTSLNTFANRNVATYFQRHYCQIVVHNTVNNFALLTTKGIRVHQYVNLACRILETMLLSQ